MTCSECQVQIFDGELDRDAVVHLTACEECRALDREVCLNVAALAAMRGEVLPVRRTRRWPWLVAAAAVLVAAVGLTYWPEKSVPQVAVASVPSVTPSLPVPIAPQPAPRVRRARVAKLVAPAEPLLVKFVTDDPDIVIYWLIDPVKGEQTL